MSDKPIVQNDSVVSMDYTLRVDGDVLDTSEGHEPLQFIQGSGNIIPGLERALYGMTVGESKQVQVSAADGYGEFEEEALVDVPRAEFPESIPLEIGMEIQVRDQSDRPMLAHIADFNQEHVRLDFNHPLAGKDLDFMVKITALRSATHEELEHGHVHFDGHAH